MESSFQWNAKTKVEFLKKLPSEARIAEALGFKPEKILIVYDSRLYKNDVTRKWLKDFPLAYGVGSGEGLKDVNSFSNHLKKIFKLITPFSARSLCVVGLGGGSVGDFTGFLSSVLKRGVPLIHIPSTLLAAMDSAHGGKTALNVGGFKNQVGTFYPADAVLIVKSLFEGLPPLQIQSASGELAKMALIEGGKLFTRFLDEFKMDIDAIWDLLPAAIEAKYKVVEKDPFEKSGERQVLNLGHSLGHALESYYGLAHGIAVGQGLIFALNWSEHQGYFRGTEPHALVDVLSERVGLLKPREFAKKYRPMSRAKLSKLVIEDKKLTDTRHMSFVFLEKIGAPFRKVVTVDSLLTETQRQGWTSL
ncbi:MAG: 3-dehydroquinate synthase family protein [Bdellovibrionales bacterium]